MICFVIAEGDTILYTVLEYRRRHRYLSRAGQSTKLRCLQVLSGSLRAYCLLRGLLFLLRAPSPVISLHTFFVAPPKSNSRHSE